MKTQVTLVNDKLAHARGGEVVLYKRGDSKRWQARYKLKDLKWHRLATKHETSRTAIEQCHQLMHCGVWWQSS